MSIIIPEDAFLIKTGLYCYEYTVTVGNITRVIWRLYSAEGYCFYDLQQPENYDEEGNLLPADQLVYAQFMSMPKDEEYVENNIISVPVQPGYEIVNRPIDTETI